MSTATYELLLGLIQNTVATSDSGSRDAKWATSAQVVGVARDPEGKIEIFLVGLKLIPASIVVREAIDFIPVRRNDGSTFNANRLRLPALGHFDQVAAFICTELLRNGADQSLHTSFSKVEPLIEMAIEQVRLSRQAVLGLAGELLVLEVLCRRADDARVLSVINSWTGWKVSSRDITTDTAGVEIKTTTASVSSHLVEGVHQVEASQLTSDSAGESYFFIVSIGLQQVVAAHNAFSIPEVVDQILVRLRGVALSETVVAHFLSRVAIYGADFGAGYDHGSDSSDPAYGMAFSVRFFRLYDMQDEGVRVLRRQHVTPHSHTDASSVRFRIDLPVVVSATNPVSGANQVADSLLKVMDWRGSTM